MSNEYTEEETGLSPDLNEGLATLFLWWYGNHFAIRQVLRDKKNYDEDSGQSTINYGNDMNLQDVEDAWRLRWFAKGDLQIPVDTFIRENFAWMLRHDVELKKFCPSKLWEKLAMIILFDQITRNALRGTPAAYQYDEVALPIALDLASKENLPFEFQATVAICLCHSESLHIQESLASYVAQMMDGDNVHPLRKAVFDIARKHHERVVEFGRFPERNHILRRTNTTREEAYLSQLK